jgi:hypothetical protein
MCSLTQIADLLERHAAEATSHRQEAEAAAAEVQAAQEVIAQKEVGWKHAHVCSDVCVFVCVYVCVLNS